MSEEPTGATPVEERQAFDYETTPDKPAAGGPVPPWTPLEG